MNLSPCADSPWDVCSSGRMAPGDNNDEDCRTTVPAPLLGETIHPVPEWTSSRGLYAALHADLVTGHHPVHVLNSVRHPRGVTAPTAPEAAGRPPTRGAASSGGGPGFQTPVLPSIPCDPPFPSGSKNTQLRITAGHHPTHNPILLPGHSRDPYSHQEVASWDPSSRYPTPLAKPTDDPKCRPPRGAECALLPGPAGVRGGIPGDNGPETNSSSR